MRMRFRDKKVDCDWLNSKFTCMACTARTNAERFVSAIAERWSEEPYWYARALNPIASICGLRAMVRSVLCVQTIRSVVAVLGLAAATCQGFAQVVSPLEILDGHLRELQQKHMADLKKVATQISAHPFPYRLYFSRTLDLSEEQQKRSDQRSIRFDNFRDQTVLEITANYYASY